MPPGDERTEYVSKDLAIRKSSPVGLIRMGKYVLEARILTKYRLDGEDMRELGSIIKTYDVYPSTVFTILDEGYRMHEVSEFLAARDALTGDTHSPRLSSLLEWHKVFGNSEPDGEELSTSIHYAHEALGKFTYYSGTVDFLLRQHTSMVRRFPEHDFPLEVVLEMIRDDPFGYDPAQIPKSKTWDEF